MNPSLDNEIREKLASYLVGEISLEEFEDWFVPASWNVGQGKNQSAINMVYEIELRLSEYSDGFRNEDELRSLLKPLLENCDFNIEPIPAKGISSNARVDQWSISVFSNILYSTASL
jgi:hypothetical protein